MNEVTRTALNSPGVQKFYETRMVDGGFAPAPSANGQQGSGLITDLIGGLAGNIANVVNGATRLHASRKRKTGRAAGRKASMLARAAKIGSRVARGFARAGRNARRPKRGVRKAASMTGRGLRKKKKKQSATKKPCKRRAPSKRTSRKQKGKGGGRLSRSSGRKFTI